MQILVIGAGVVGLAVARAAALAGHDVIVAEATPGIGNGVSSRNSEVIHGGMYYPAGSLRARHCIRGRRMLYAFCAAHGVPFRQCGKLIVATNAAEAEKIAGIQKQGTINGVEELELIGGNAARDLEPALTCVAAVHSPQTGIIDSHAFMLALEGELEDRGGMIAFAAAIERLSPAARGWTVRFAGKEAGTLDVDGGLGIHVTLDLAGRMRFGPDVEWIDAEAYAVVPRRADGFYARIRTY